MCVHQYNSSMCVLLLLRNECACEDHRSNKLIIWDRVNIVCTLIRISISRSSVWHPRWCAIAREEREEGAGDCGCSYILITPVLRIIPILILIVQLILWISHPIWRQQQIAMVLMFYLHHPVLKLTLSLVKVRYELLDILAWIKHWCNACMIRERGDNVSQDRKKQSTLRFCVFDSRSAASELFKRWSLCTIE